MKPMAWTLAVMTVNSLLPLLAYCDQPNETSETTFVLRPIGRVEKTDNRTWIRLDQKYAAGLLGLDGFSHLYMFWWFDRNDTPVKRGILQVHPMGNQQNPLTGVFATRSPVRPNLIAMTLCKIVSIKENAIEIEGTDAFDGTPVLDIKPFIPGYDTATEASVPDWLEKEREKPAQQLSPPPNSEHLGLHNVMRLSDRVVSGSAPDGDSGFKTLAEMGVKTIVSVESVLPDLELAKKHGLRYTHVPIRYNGIPNEAGQALARVMQETEGLVYIHCRHGGTRGPAAAAVACIASGAATNQDAVEILQRAGLGADYQGLWRDVKSYQPPGPGTNLPELVEIAEIGSLAAAMAEIGLACDNLKLCQEAEWGAPEEHPDLVPALQSFLVRETFRGAQQNLPDAYDDRFTARLSGAEQVADRLGRALLDGNARSADEHYNTLMQFCKDCHGQYRN